MNKDSLIYVAGHRGMVGSAIVRKLESMGYNNILVRTSSEIDLRNQQQVETFFSDHKPEYVFMAAAKVGGIHANNTYRAEFMYDNLQIQNNIIHSSHINKVKKLMFLGSSCIYPKACPQPIKEEYLLSGYMEQTNEPYALAKIAGLKLCESYSRQFGHQFFSLMPTNMYGPNDNYDLQNSHVLPALIRKFHEAKINKDSHVKLWGTGKPMREFMHVDDCAEACVYFMNNYKGYEWINIGSGKDLSIHQLALLIKKVVGYDGDLLYDASKPDGTMRKVMDISKAKEIGWEAKISLEEGLKMVYKDFVENIMALTN